MGISAEGSSPVNDGRRELGEKEQLLTRPALRTAIRTVALLKTDRLSVMVIAPFFLIQVK
jgi:hypothetical protein